MLTGHADRLPTYIRAGTVDVFYLRPLPLIGQLITSDFQLRRMARMAVGAAVLVVGLVRNDVVLDLRAIAIIVMALTCGFVIFAALFVAAAGAQFFLVNGAEVTNAFTYGGAFAAGQPASLFSNGLKILFGYVFPTVFTGYVPAVALLGLPGTALLPVWLVWLLPVAALWMVGVAAFLWRAGVRHYQGAGG
jgi:viologen exporter family transport system permease protein